MSLTRLMRRGWSGLALLGTALAAAAAFTTPAFAAPTEGTVLYAGESTAISGSYIVVFEDGAAVDGVGAAAQDLAAEYGGTVTETYRNALRGFAASMSAADAARLAADPQVAYVQADRVVSLAGTQSPVPSWGLDRIDQRALPLNNSYTYPNTASGVKAYIIDTGIRFTHADFGGRAVSGRDTVDNDNDATDCNGHGTHVAGTTGGTAHGVAKGVTLVGVRVLDCGGSGSYAGVVAGIDWVTGDHAAGAPAVANMSLGGGFDQATNDAVTASIADGVSFAVAAGNDYSADACQSSPASTPNAITVGSTDSNDAKSDFSNIGTCLDIFAPGRGITSAWYTSDTATNTISGTSMATPHVAGAAALVLSANPSYTPQQVRDKLVNDATNGVVTGPGTGSPNKLLYVGNIQPPTQDFSIAVAPGSGTVNPGQSVTATVSTQTTVGAAQTVNLTASGLPAGATATFSPAQITSGASSTLTIATAASTPPGTYTVGITGTGTVTTQTTSFTLTVNGPPGCTQTNATDVAIPDNSTVSSSITISGCAGNAGAASTVAVTIAHTYIGDLVVSLIAPDGSAYVLHNRAGGSADNINQTYTVNLAGETANGTWKLQVQDAASADTGTLDTWTLNLTGGGPGTCNGSNGTDVAIPDNTTVSSSVAVTGCGRAPSATSTVEVHIVHTYIGDLVVSLIAPDGSAYVLHNRAGGSADNINQTYTVNLAGETANGTWKLQVQDAASADTGRIDTWTLTL
ncbi:S8 family serine peptidase [Phytomonospora endophytica]|uniref:Subtilisin family serine protease/subtilisin-like proprotein convertase family protein n=2 Tax=Phytomonospora endophytica TaxID=714109 RepID=A0A841FT29_9ACTN|nr:S8 family serine peptidase [Phytomonospora endophytica]MBB6036898.1 subtilisin family serine protease/subtilisin-like proprotein convertase family protein [Phytomonospora endophytica]